MSKSPNMGKAGKKKKASKKDDSKVTYLFRDLNPAMVDAWKEEFKDYPEQVKVSQGDIFKDAPAADAIVSPANSFGFMDGGIDMVYTWHFGWQMQERLQEVIREEYNGEVLVGQAAIIPSMPSEAALKEQEDEWKGCNEDQPIRFLVSAPTMRVPLDVSDTVNAFLAFRAVILAVRKHNRDPSNSPIRSVLCPGLGTAVGRMKPAMCASQMLNAFQLHELGEQRKLTAPKHLAHVSEHHDNMTSCRLASKPFNSSIPPPPKMKPKPSSSSKLKPKPGEGQSEIKSSTWKSYCYIALWFILSIVGLIGGFYLEVYLASRYEKPLGGDVVTEEDIMDGGEEL